MVWTLEVGVPYELRYVDLMAGAHKAPEMLALNPMGKLPILIDGEIVVTETARPAWQRGEARNAAVREEHGLTRR